MKSENLNYGTNNSQLNYSPKIIKISAGIEIRILVYSQRPPSPPVGPDRWETLGKYDIFKANISSSLMTFYSGFINDKAWNTITWVLKTALIMQISILGNFKSALSRILSFGPRGTLWNYFCKHTRYWVCSSWSNTLSVATQKYVWWIARKDIR